MTELYIRKVRVTLIPRVGTGKSLENLKFIFSVEKTNEKSTNKGTLEIYNLNNNSRGILESKNARIVIEAGYQDSFDVIYQGNVTKVVHESTPPDIVTKIELGDGDNAYRTSRIEEGLPPGASARQAFNLVAQNMGVAQGAIIGVPNDRYANGIVLSGMTREVLDELCKKNDLEWSIQNEALQILPKNSFTTESIIVLNSRSGLIGSPSKTKKGVEFQSLLQPNLTPGRRVKIESKFVNGIYKIRKVQHQGDSIEGEFLSKCEATVS